MPHLTIQYSANIESALSMPDYCDALYQVMLGSGVFPLAGIRVRAFRADHVVIADKLADNAYIDMVLRMGEGRSAEDRERVGESIMASAASSCSELMSQPHFALSLEIVEISRQFSWKKNTIHARLAEKPA